MFDIFYIGKKPNLFPHERDADSIQDAQDKSRTRFFWIINTYSDYEGWDFLWEPVPWESHQRHAWPSQWQKDSETYLVPKQGYAETNYRSDRSIMRLPCQDQWQDSKYQVKDFDYSWHPDPADPPLDYQFGTQWQLTGGPVFKTANANGVKYVESPRAVKTSVEDNWEVPEHITDFDFTWHPDDRDPPLDYQFGTQWQLTGGPLYRIPGADKTKYVSSPRAVKTSIDDNWEIPDHIDDFDFTWHPDKRDPIMNYQFGTQWQKTGGPLYRIPGADKTKYVTQVRAKGKRIANQAVVVNHLNANYIPPDIEIIKTSRYFDNYLDTLKRVSKTLPEDQEFVWILSSLCDYTDFDFTWHPEQWQQGMLHVFQSDGEKFGDTFFMHVPSFRDRIGSVELLDWYDLNFVDMSVPRLPIPWIRHDDDSHVDQVKNCQLTDPLIVFQNADYSGSLPAIPLWRAETKTVTPLTKGGSTVIVPRQAITAVQEQLWDYEYVDKRHQIVDDIQQDVIFISNGEPMALANYENLLKIFPDAKHSQGVTGREAAYKAAARMSDTPWFFAVFAKTEVLPTFDFSYQPDRLQAPKHYIFHSRNPLNGLEYGAMNINLYNKQLVLDTKPGLDFTLSQLHEVVPICASISRFNTDPWITWRSAFREVLKLKQEVDLKGSVEIAYRLKKWCTKAKGDNAEYCLKGANDALSFYESVDGDPEQLQLSFDWAWLQEHYEKLYNETPWQD